MANQSKKKMSEDTFFGWCIGIPLVFSIAGSFVGTWSGFDYGRDLGLIVGIFLGIRLLFSISHSTEFVRSSGDANPSSSPRFSPKHLLLMVVFFPVTIYFLAGITLFEVLYGIQAVIKRLAVAEDIAGLEAYAPRRLHKSSIWLILFFPVFVPSFLIWDLFVLLPYSLLWLILRLTFELFETMRGSINRLFGE